MNMRRFLICTVSVIAANFATAALAGPDDAAERFAEGRKLLVEGDIDGALKAFVAATKADPKNDAYRQKAALVQRIAKMRRGLDKLEGTDWLTTADALHAFYCENGVLAEANVLASRIHAKVGTPASAAKAARAKLALGLNAEAAKLMQTLDPDERTPETRVLLSIALARQGLASAAKAAMADLVPPEGASHGLLLEFACAYAGLGQTTDAVKMLTRSFEQTPPSQLEAAKGRAKESPDLAALRTDAAFIKALATKSKVAESECSTGDDCGKCPSRTKCASEKTDADKKDAGKKPADKKDAGQPG